MPSTDKPADMDGLSQRIDDLAREKDKYQNLVEGSIQGILIQRDWKPIFVNESFARIFGYDSPQQFLE